tara:strand:+ start:2139 stop:2273 length:135 start_codon:yes stop_codon:yes gene_type:complete
MLKKISLLVIAIGILIEIMSPVKDIGLIIASIGIMAYVYKFYKK